MTTATQSQKQHLNPHQQSTSAQLVISLIVILSIAAISYYSNNDDISYAKFPNHQKNGTPDYFALNARIDSYDDTGKATHLKARSIFHYIGKEKTFLKQPDFFYQKDESPWEATAKHGIMYTNTKLLELSDNVVISSQDLPSSTTKSGDVNNNRQNNARITTNMLNVHTERKYAETKQPVMVTTDDAIIKATGMTADYESGLIQLLSNVWGVYETK